MNTVRSRAFTLIELLVVIAIIAILAAILFPVFAQAKAAAKKTVDMSNNKEQATAIVMYSGDADDFFPRFVYYPADRVVNGWSTPFTWREAIMPYVKNGQKNYGTSTKGVQVQLADGGLFDSPAKPGARGSYTMNRNIAPGQNYWNATTSSWDSDANSDGSPSGKPVFPSVSQTTVDAPANVITTFSMGVNPDWNASGDYSEGSWWWWGGAQYPPVFTGPTSHEKWDADSNVDPTWHSPRYRFNGMNNAFADGHAKFVRKGAMNWCKYVYVKGAYNDMNDNWDWLFDPGNACAAFRPMKKFLPLLPLALLAVGCSGGEATDNGNVAGAAANAPPKSVDQLPKDMPAAARKSAAGAIKEESAMVAQQNAQMEAMKKATQGGGK